MDVEPEEAMARDEESHASRSLSGSIMMWPYEEHQPLRIRQRHLELLFEPDGSLGRFPARSDAIKGRIKFKMSLFCL